jgi:hypothetical protein
MGHLLTTHSTHVMTEFVVAGSMFHSDSSHCAAEIISA